jgi:hypothetical protein
LRGGGRFINANSGKFLALSVSQLMPAFVVLIVETVWSSSVFIGELILNPSANVGEKLIRELGE